MHFVQLPTPLKEIVMKINFTKKYTHLPNCFKIHFVLKRRKFTLCFTPLRYSRGCWWGFLFSTFLKNGLHADRIVLCASIWALSSQARVTSKKSRSFLKSRNAELIFDSKSFHLRQNFSAPMAVNTVFFL